jgi:putative N6-adenine-specific DNA methylase
MGSVPLLVTIWTLACSYGVGAFGLNGGIRQYFATTASGMEPILAKELQQLPEVSSIKVGKSGVEFEGSTRTGLEGLLWLRTPLKLMEKVSVANRVTSKNSLHEWVHGCAQWDEMITPQNTLKCDAILGKENSAELSHSHFTALTVKNAIVDQIRDRLGNRPSVDLCDPDLPLLLYLHRGKGTLYRVWSGEHSMHKRGYRPDVTHKAALRETTAAAM